MGDLQNNIVKVGGATVRIDFTIQSEQRINNKRVLQLLGADDNGVQYTATGYFDKETYRLVTQNVKTVQ